MAAVDRARRRRPRRRRAHRINDARGRNQAVGAARLRRTAGRRDRRGKAAGTGRARGHAPRGVVPTGPAARRGGRVARRTARGGHRRWPVGAGRGPAPGVVRRADRSVGSSSSGRTTAPRRACRPSTSPRAAPGAWRSSAMSSAARPWIRPVRRSMRPASIEPVAPTSGSGSARWTAGRPDGSSIRCRPTLASGERSRPSSPGPPTANGSRSSPAARSPVGRGSSPGMARPPATSRRPISASWSGSPVIVR